MNLSVDPLEGEPLCSLDIQNSTKIHKVIFFRNGCKDMRRKSPWPISTLGDNHHFVFSNRKRQLRGTAGTPWRSGRIIDKAMHRTDYRSFLGTKLRA